MRIFYLMSLSLFSVVALFSCTKDSQSHQSQASKDVYILGAQYINFPEIPTYWKNGSPVLLADTNLNPESIAVSGSDIYVGGWDRGAITVYYKNNTRNVFDDAIFSNASMGLTVSGEDIYMTGVANSTATASYWKNNLPVEVDWALGAGAQVQSSGTAVASAVAVSGDDIYFAGQVVDTIANNRIYVPMAAYWKNGKINFLDRSAVYAQPTGIAIESSNVYISANKTNYLSADGTFTMGGSDTAMYWVNGVSVILGAGYSNSIFVSNGDVYVCGTTLDGSAVYWKNGNQVILAPNANTKGIVVVDNDVYVAGNLGYRYGVYWKNGVVDTLCTNGFITAITLGN
jgi:hypothetical protein